MTYVDNRDFVEEILKREVTVKNYNVMVVADRSNDLVVYYFLRKGRFVEAYRGSVSDRSLSEQSDFVVHKPDHSTYRVVKARTGNDHDALRLMAEYIKSI